MQTGLVFNRTLRILIVKYGGPACNPTLVVGAGGAEIKGHLQIHSKFKNVKRMQAVELCRSLLCSTRAFWYFKLNIYQELNYMKLLRLHLKV